MIKGVIIALCVAVTVPVVQAQTFETCADLNGDSALNISDLVYWFEVFQGARDLPAGKGDIDFRQGINLGDFRYFSGFIFRGYPEGGCPPFSPYEVQNTSDSLILPIMSVPAGDGSLVAPIAFINHSAVTDILVPFLVTGSGSNVTLDSISSPFDQGTSIITVKHTEGDRGMFLFTALSGSLSPGRRIIARAHFSYTASSGGTLFLTEDDPSPSVRLSYVFGSSTAVNYDDLDVGVPTILMSSEIPFIIPGMSVSSDTLEFVYTSGTPDPEPQFVHVKSDGGSFSWTAQVTLRYRVSPRSGVSGDSISVQPRADIFNFGTTYDVLEIISSGSNNSPVVVTLKTHVKPPYAANDADCDGDFDLTDLVILINYLYRNGAEPCDPFSTSP